MSSSDEEKLRSVTEADYQSAEKLIHAYIDEYHQPIYWHLRTSCSAKKEHADDAMQNLWLYVFRQLLFKRANKMYRSFLYNKALWLLIDIHKKLIKEDPLDLSLIDLRNQDELEKHTYEALEEMLDKGSNEKSSESPFEGEDAALFDRFWQQFPNVDLTDKQKIVAFDRYHNGLTLQEVSKKYGFPKSTLSDWMKKVKREIETAQRNKKEDN